MKRNSASRTRRVVSVLGCAGLAAVLVLGACRDAPTAPGPVLVGRYVLVSVDGQPLPVAIFTRPDTGLQDIDTSYVTADTVVFGAAASGPPSASFDELLVQTLVDAGNSRSKLVQHYGGIAWLQVPPDSIRVRGGYAVGGPAERVGDTLRIVSNEMSFSPGHSWVFVRR